MAYLNRCIWRPTTGGTGTWTVSSAIAGFRLPVDCVGPSVLDLAEYPYFAESDDRSAWEVGKGVYTASGTTLTRADIFDSTNGGAAVNFTTAPRVAMGCPLASSIRELLTADRTYYVRTGGSDSNSGLADTNGGAFLTIQKAIDTIAATLDLGGFTVTIQVRSGTYTQQINITSPWVGAGTVSLQGDTTTPANVVLSITGDHVIHAVGSGVTLTIGGFKLTTTTFGDCIFADYGATVVVNGKMDYGTCARFHNYASRRSTIDLTSVSYNVTGAATYHFYADNQSQVVVTAAAADFGGAALAFTWFAVGATLGAIFATAYSYTNAGSVTGTRYFVSENAVIYANGGGANHFPGSVAGAGTNSGTNPYGLYV